MTVTVEITRGLDERSPLVSHFPRDRWFVIAILVNTVATTVLILIATTGQITVIAVSVASVTGTMDIAAMFALCYKKCRASHPQDRSENQDEDPLHIQILPPITNCLTSDEWTARLTDTPVRSSVPTQFKLYNLHDEIQPLAQKTKKGYLALPMFGTYDIVAYNNLIYSPSLGARLPLAQYQGFPETVKKSVNFSAHLELYFLVYFDIHDKTTERNLVLHFMAMPTYEQARMECSVKIAILEPHGLHFYNHRDGLSSNAKRFPLILHSAKDGFAISPNNCLFQIDPAADLCRFYLAAQIQNRSILCYTLILRKQNTFVGQILTKAANQETLSDSLRILQDSAFPFHQEITHLFQYY